MEVKDDGEKTKQVEMSEREDENDDDDKMEIKMIRDGMEKHVNKMVFREQLSSSSFSRERSIYRVPQPLRNVNVKAYTPQVISIGPFHYNPSPKDPTFMEKKGAYVFNFLAVAKLSWDEMVEKAVSWEERARKCYVETIKMERAEFLKLIVLDGCFVVMYIIGSMFPEFRDLDTSFLWRFNNAIFKDLLLLENQLPFFLLHELYDLCASSQPEVLEGISFVELLREYFSNAREGMRYVERGFHVDSSKVNHLVDFLRIHLTHPRCQEYNLDFMVSNNPSLFSFWPLTATQLYECGISFQKNRSNYLLIMQDHKCVMDMYFRERGGVLKMPEIIIDDCFEISLRNMIGYEYCHLQSKDVSNFAMFMGFLINTDKDVSLLIDDGIIRNQLGSTKEIAGLFNDLCKHIMVERNLYNLQCLKIREYCRHRRHRWMTTLKRDYFGTPWAFISFIAALVLLSLTLLQTVLAFIALYK